MDPSKQLLLPSRFPEAWLVASGPCLVPGEKFNVRVPLTGADKGAKNCTNAYGAPVAAANCTGAYAALKGINGIATCLDGLH